MSKGKVRLVVSYKINDFDLFKTVAEECSRYVSNNEEGTLAYDWYVSENRTDGKLIEVYKNKEAFEEHLAGPVFAQIGPKFKKSIKWVSIESFGELPEIFYKILGAVPNTNWISPEICAE